MRQPLTAVDVMEKFQERKPASRLEAEKRLTTLQEVTLKQYQESILRALYAPITSTTSLEFADISIT